MAHCHAVTTVGQTVGARPDLWAWCHLGCARQVNWHRCWRDPNCGVFLWTKRMTAANPKAEGRAAPPPRPPTARRRCGPTPVCTCAAGSYAVASMSAAPVAACMTPAAKLVCSYCSRRAHPLRRLSGGTSPKGKSSAHPPILQPTSRCDARACHDKGWRGAMQGIKPKAYVGRGARRMRTGQR